MPGAGGSRSVRNLPPPPAAPSVSATSVALRVGVVVVEGVGDVAVVVMPVVTVAVAARGQQQFSGVVVVVGDVGLPAQKGAFLGGGEGGGVEEGGAGAL